MKNTFNNEVVSALLVSPVITKPTNNIPATEAISGIKKELELAVNVDLLEDGLSDNGNLNRFVKYCGSNYKFNVNSKSWLQSVNNVWVEVLDDCKSGYDSTIAEFAKQACSITDKEDRNNFFKFINSSNNAGRFNNAMSLATKDYRLMVRESDLNSDIYSIATKNRKIDLRTGESRPIQKSDLISKTLDIDYDPEAKCPLWLQFLDTATDGDKEYQEYLKRVIGYSLTGSIKEQQMWFLYGSGANGKSVFLDIIGNLAGDYGQTAPTTLFDADYSGVPEDVARLSGKRVVIASELDEGMYFAEAKIKRLTGEKTLTARFFHGSFFEFTATHHLFLASNHKPNVRGTEHAIWRRLKLLPFTVTIPDHKKDLDLTDKLIKELPGILNWAIEGAKEWFVNGLGEPACVTEATKEYREQQDVIGQFLQECTEPDHDSLIQLGCLYATYTTWANQNGVKFPLTKQKLNNKIEERKAAKKVRKEKGWFFQGLRLV